MRFRNGLLNCLFATSVAEEGLDVPDCNLVIRFDLYSTVIQYIQSRGRARQANSRYIHMIEKGNREHIALLKEVRKNEGILRQFCQALPADRLLTGNDFDMDYFLSKERQHRVYTEPSTGAKLTYKKSLAILANFVSSLPHSSETSLTPEYFMASQNKQFICEVILPDTAPIRGAVGRPASTKQVAKCSAAFEACLILRRGKYLDANLLSTYVKQLPAMRNAHLALNSKKQEAYDMRTKPELWSVDSIPDKLYLTVFTIADPSCLLRPSQPLGLLTRSALPQFPDIPLFFGQGRQSRVMSRPLSKAIQLETSMLDMINEFTLRIFDDVFSKEYIADLARTPYFLVPIKISTLVTDSPTNLIAWDILIQVQANVELHWNDNTPDAFFEDRYIVDLYDGSRKLWTKKVTHDYKPLDPVPPETAPRAGTRKNNDNITEYSCSLWSKARSYRTFREDQPVVEAEYIPLRRNLLDDGDFVESEAPKKCFIILEPLKISAVS
jgi:endoribonuclease Dicer